MCLISAGGVRKRLAALAGHEFCPPAPGQVAGELGVLIILELLDLVRRPALRHADERVGDRAFGKIIELPELARFSAA
jgi:hypothetical protein